MSEVQKKKKSDGEGNNRKGLVTTRLPIRRSGYEEMYLYDCVTMVTCSCGTEHEKIDFCWAKFVGSSSDQ